MYKEDSAEFVNFWRIMQANRVYSNKKRGRRNQIWRFCYSQRMALLLGPVHISHVVKMIFTKNVLRFDKLMFSLVLTSNIYID